EKTVDNNEELLLTAFNEKNMDNGFYKKRVSQNGDPDSLFMGPYFFAHDRKIKGNLMPNPYGIGMMPVKAANTNNWIVRRESAVEAPNYFFTKDFKIFKPLTHLEPQRKYNWYTTELVNYTQDNGIEGQGVLFKPKDFNPKNKYPVLLYYYEQYSSILNKFIPPAASESGKPNIPWYVSRGYLVFTPDNFFQKGWRNKSVKYSVDGAAKELTKRSYVDAERMGIMGLSQGGGFTNYILTHSNLFAAAFEGCGVSDRISAGLQWGGVNGEAGSRLGSSEMLNGTNMWDSSDQWVDESPVLNVHKVTTPLLIMHNKADGAVLFEQGIEMFTALRRWNKKVWLLQYDEGGHGVGSKDALDLTTRMTQYFDHYLKGKPPPCWMTSGIPRYLKGIENRYELDPAGYCSKDCKICQKKNYN
ncbi:MAG: S9 family peptidase, partial [Chitinophagaceae bacterium]|nr:S9 family peptidase [Chitinophagaceae bacterium]